MDDLSFEEFEIEYKYLTSFSSRKPILFDISKIFMLNVLCEVLNDFKRLMQDFGVEEYRACGTSAFRELVNPLLIIEQIYQRTGMKIEILSISESIFPSE